MRADDRVRYIYFRDEQRIPFGTVTFKIENDGTLVRFGYSFCHPKDHLDKNRGKMIACYRMNSGEFTLALSGHEDFNEVRESIRSHVRENHWPAGRS